VDETVAQTPAAAAAIRWFDAKLSDTVAQVEDHYRKFRISDALMAIYKLFWDDYCAWYLEAIKPAFGQPVDKATYDATLGYFEALLKLIHPVMPFITEELWQNMEERKEGETIMYARTPAAKPFDPQVLVNFELAEEAVNGARGIRNQKNIAPKETLELKVKGDFPTDVIPVIEKMGNVTVEKVADFSEKQGVGFMVRTYEMFVALNGLVNVEEEIAKLEKDLAYQQKFLAGVRGKLSNERFVAHAPAAVIENERKKEADSLSKIESLESQLKALRNS